MIFSLFLSQNHHSQRIHHSGNINSFGAPRCTLKAGGTEPVGIDSKGFFFQTQQCISNDLVGTNLHGKGNWTSSRTIPTLVAGKKVLSTDQLHLLRKFIMNLLSRQLYLHLPSPYPPHPHPLLSEPEALLSRRPPVEREINRPPLNPLPLDGGGGGWG